MLQTLKTLTSLSKMPDLMAQFRHSNIFTKLQVITNSLSFGRNVDLKTALYQLLEVVSAQDPQICVSELKPCN